MSTNRRDFLRKSGWLVASGSILPLIQACSKNGVSPLSMYSICQNTCVGCGDCLEVCQDNAVVLPKPSYYRIEVSECTSCAECVPFCPHEAIQVITKNYSLNSETCVGCGKCIDICKNEGNAISWERDYYTIRGKCKPDKCNQECAAACEENAISIVDGKAIIDIEKCTRCGKCVSACPREAVNPAHVLLDESLCTHCGKCVDACEFENVILVTEPENYVEPHIDPELCQFCGECQEACTDFEAIHWANNKASIDTSLCSGCGKCKTACTFDAVRAP